MVIRHEGLTIATRFLSLRLRDEKNYDEISIVAAMIIRSAAICLSTSTHLG